MTPRNSSACLAGPGWTCLWPVFALHLGQIGTNIVRDFLATHLECQPVGDDGEWVVFQHRTASYVGCNAVCPVPCGFGMGHIRTRRPTGGYVAIFATPVLITGPHSLLISRQGGHAHPPPPPPVRGFSDVDTLQCYPVLAPNALL